MRVTSITIGIILLGVLVAKLYKAGRFSTLWAAIGGTAKIGGS